MNLELTYLLTELLTIFSFNQHSHLTLIMYAVAIRYVKVNKNKAFAYETKNLRSGKLEGNYNNTWIKYYDVGKHEGWL